MKKSVPLLLLLCLPVFYSCISRELKTELRKLDDVIEKRDIHIAEFEARISALRDSLSNADKDSLKWQFSYRLFEEYYRFNTDSSLIYLDRMMGIASDCNDEKMRHSSTLASIRLAIARNSIFEACKDFEKIDTCGLSLNRDDMLEYYNTLSQYYVFIRGIEKDRLVREDIKEKLSECRQHAIELDSVSVKGRRLAAIIQNQNKNYVKSLEILLECWNSGPMSNLDRTLTAYNISNVYKHLGNEEQQMIWLAKSAQYDFRVPVKNYLSVYHLAMLLNKHKKSDTALKYININMADLLESNYRQRIQMSGASQILISGANTRVQIQRSIYISIFSLILLAMTFVLLSFLKKNKSLVKITGEKNEELSKLNGKLSEANIIKEKYLFKYMGLSTHYLTQVEGLRHDLRQTAKQEGLEAVLEKLRSHGSTDDEMKRFFKTFDETFLSIFPDFVEQVNALLREEGRFELKKDSSLPTELRILAVIRLGMKESGKIAEFLYCAAPTVYTYRTKLLNLASCPREEFEENVMKINSY